MKNTDSQMDEKKLRQVSRRELLKLTPVLALGAFAIPGWQDGLLKKGLGFNDWAAARLTSAVRCARISAMSKTKDNNPSRGDLVRLTARCKAAG